MEIGIVGLPNVGKSTIFNALTEGNAPNSNYPFTTIEPNVGIVTVPDERLLKIAAIYKPKKITPAVIRFVDIAGLVKGASKGEGLGNKFLAHIREVDAIAHIVRCFDDENITHVSGKISPLDDMDIINLELIFADMDTVEKRIEKTKRTLSTGEKKCKIEYDFLLRLKEHLENGKPARTLDTAPDELRIIMELNLLTVKPILYVANVCEDDIKTGKNNPYVEKVSKKARDENSEVITVSAKIESEIAELTGEDRKLFLNELGISEPGLEKLIKAAYRLLGLITYFTAGEPEGRAWTVKLGTKAPQAAGVIHTDFEKGFIRAEVMNFEDLNKYGSASSIREKGLVRLEGKNYTVVDGDIMYFRFTP